MNTASRDQDENSLPPDAWMWRWGKHDIELQCRWSTDRANSVRTVQQSMIHNYSEVRNMKQALIHPSKACWDWHQGPWSQSNRAWLPRALGFECGRWEVVEVLFPQLRRYPPHVFGIRCLEPSPWLILLGSMSIQLRLDLLDSSFLRHQAAC